MSPFLRVLYILCGIVAEARNVELAAELAAANAARTEAEHKQAESRLAEAKAADERLAVGE